MEEHFRFLKHFFDVKSWKIEKKIDKVFLLFFLIYLFIQRPWKLIPEKNSFFCRIVHLLLKFDSSSEDNQNNSNKVYV